MRKLLSAIRRSAFVHGKKRVRSKAMNVIWGRASEGVRVGAFLPPNANETLQLPAMSLIYAVERMGVSSRLIDRWSPLLGDPAFLLGRGHGWHGGVGDLYAVRCMVD